jgi:voltage-gated potassium channel
MSLEDPREQRLASIERATDPLLLVLAVLLIPLLVVPLVVTLNESASRAVLIADWLIWGVFAGVFLLKFVLAPRKIPFLRTHWFEALMVVLPFLRPLRVARVLRLGVIFGLNTSVLRRIASQRGIQLVVLAALLIVVLGATLTFAFERNHEGSNIKDFGDALWWSVVTTTTVGYGDHSPVSPAGRGVAVLLMLTGIAALSAATANIAALLVREDEPGAQAEEMRELRDAVASLERRIVEMTAVIGARQDGRNV